MTHFLKIPLVTLCVYSPLLLKAAECVSHSIIQKVMLHHVGVDHPNYGKSFADYLRFKKLGPLQITYAAAARALTEDKKRNIFAQFQNSTLILLHDASNSTNTDGPTNIAKTQAQCHLNYLQLLYTAGVTDITVHLIPFSYSNACSHKSIHITTSEEFHHFIQEYTHILPYPDLNQTYLSPALTHVSKILGQIRTEQRIQIAIATDGAIDENDVPKALAQIGKIKRPNDLYTIGVQVFTAGALAAPNTSATPKCLNEENPYNLIQPNQARAEQFRTTTSGGAEKKTVTDDISAMLQDITPAHYPQLFAAAFATVSGPGCVMKDASLSIEDMATLLSEKQILVLFSTLAGENAFFRELSLDARREIDAILEQKLNQHTDPFYNDGSPAPVERIVLRILREGVPNSHQIERDCCVVFDVDDDVDNEDGRSGIAIVVDPKFVKVKDGMLSATEASSAAYKQLVLLATIYAQNPALVKRERRSRSGNFKNSTIVIDGIEVLQLAPVYTITEKDFEQAVAELQTKQPAPAPAGLVEPEVVLPEAETARAVLRDPDEVPAASAPADAVPAPAPASKPVPTRASREMIQAKGAPHSTLL